MTRHELRDSLRLDGEALSAAIAQLPGSAQSSPRRPSSSPTKLTGEHVYKIILLGTAGVGKSSILAVAANGDDAYMVFNTFSFEVIGLEGINSHNLHCCVTAGSTSANAGGGVWHHRVPRSERLHRDEMHQSALVGHSRPGALSSHHSVALPSCRWRSARVRRQ